MGQACAEIQPDEVDLNQLIGSVVNTQKVTLQVELFPEPLRGLSEQLEYLNGLMY